MGLLDFLRANKKRIDAWPLSRRRWDWHAEADVKAALKCPKCGGTRMWWKDGRCLYCWGAQLNKEP